MQELGKNEKNTLFDEHDVFIILKAPFLLQISMEVPLMSQDEFFRHLNLRSVHATSAKYHYRQALKERLRASSQRLSLTPPKPPTKSPQVSPVKWLTPRTRKKMFGRPKIRAEKTRRLIDFDNNLQVIKEEQSNRHNNNQKLLASLITNCHVLRHPGIKKEVEAKISLKTEEQKDFKVSSNEFSIKDEFWTPKTSCIQIRKCYLSSKKPLENNLSGQKPLENNLSTKKLLEETCIAKRKTRRKIIGKDRKIVCKEDKIILKNGYKKDYVSQLRIQPVIKNEEIKRKKEQKLSAALALYHFYKPKTDDGHVLSLREFKKVFCSGNEHFAKNFQQRTNPK